MSRLMFFYVVFQKGRRVRSVLADELKGVLSGMRRSEFDLCALTRSLPAARSSGHKEDVDCTDIHSPHVCRALENPQISCQEILFFRKYWLHVISLLWAHFQIRRMSDSEDFSGDEEGGKLKFQPTLRFWWKFSQTHYSNFHFSVEDQPLEVIKRVKALKKLQFENIKHEVLKQQ